MKYIAALIITCLILLSENASSQTNRIHHNGQNLFVSGMNMAWPPGNFSGALVDLDTTIFISALDDISKAGGNAMRWWLHVNGSQSPQFTDDKVTGLGPNEIANMRKVLDLAQERGMSMVMCLWSFDILQPNAGSENHQRHKLIVENKEYTQAYIDHALIPIIRALKDHPAVLCWEICNEPEGMTKEFGWTPVKTTMKHVQQFVNLLAGAIHREAPHAKVSNGCHSFQGVSDVTGFSNYYRDDRLIAAGGDPDGTLDFYMVHYYPQWFDEKYSPFHNPASHWELDKPIVIGEFSAYGILKRGRRFKPATELTSKEAFEYAYNNGYAGALAWTWTNHDGNGGIDDCQPGINSLYKNHPKDIIIQYKLK